jgi:two-component system response regulator FixJ
MPAMSGLQLQQHLVRNGIHIPTIMIAAHPDAGLHVQENTGLVAFLQKPLQDSSLLAAIDKATGAPRGSG